MTGRSIDRIRRMALAPLFLVLALAACDSPEERVARHFESGQTLVADGAPEKAMLEFRNALELNDRHVPTHFAIGTLYESQGNFQAAFERYRHVVVLDPEHLEARLKVSRFYLLAGDITNAGDELAVALRLNPARIDVQVLKAALALRTDNLAMAREALDEALRLDPDHVEVLATEVLYLLKTATPATALTRVDRALIAHGDALALHALKLQILKRAGDRAGFGAQLGVMIETFPEELRFREARSNWAARNGAPDIARNDLKALAAALPGNSKAVVNLIRFMREQDGDAAARDELTRLIEAAEAPLPLELMLARFDMDTGNPAQAITGLRAIVGRAGADGDQARVALASLLYAGHGRGAEDRDEADRLIDTVLAEDPANAGALAMKITRLLEGDRLEEAARAVRLGLNEAPDDVRLLLLAGRVQELSGNIDLASDQLAKAVRADAYKPRTVERYVQFLLRLQRFTAAQIVLSEAVRRYPQDQKIADLLGFTRVRLEDWAGAEAVARRLEQLNPGRARQLHAAILIGRERFDESIRLLRDLPENENQRAKSITTLVQTYIFMGQETEALAFLDGLLAENPADLQALGMRGNLHLAADEFRAAEARYREILRLDPENGAAYSALSQLATARGDPAGARVLLQDGLAASPDSLILLSRLARQQESEGRFEAAIDAYERLYEKTPGSLLAANNLASLLADHHADDPEAIARAYTIASRLAGSTVPQYRDTYGWTRHLKGKHAVALERIEPLVDTLPENPWIRYHLGMVYLALERPQEARAQLETALDKSSGKAFPPAEAILETLAEITDR